VAARSGLSWGISAIVVVVVAATVGGGAAVPGDGAEVVGAGVDVVGGAGTTGWPLLLHPISANEAATANAVPHRAGVCAARHIDRRRARDTEFDATGAGRPGGYRHDPRFRWRPGIDMHHGGAMDLGSVGVWSAELRFGETGAAAEMAAELEALGYGALWYPAGNEGAFACAEALLSATDHIVVATGIVSVWSHDAATTAAAHARLASAHPDRFLLGLGISHRPLVDQSEPGRYHQPLATMAHYLDQLDAASPPVPLAERAIAALGPRMLELARQRSAGSHPYLVTPEHTKAARELLGAQALLAPEQAVLIETDPARARAVGRHHLELYLRLPNYVNNWRRLGFTDDDFAAGGSDRLVDSLVAWGDAETVADRVGAHLDAGATHVCLQALGGPERVPPLPTWRTLAEVLID